jgi:hypothetical protein
MKLKRRWALWSGQHSNFSPIEASTLSLTRVLEGRRSRFRRSSWRLRFERTSSSGLFTYSKSWSYQKPQIQLNRVTRYLFRIACISLHRTEIETRDKPCSSGETCLIRLASLLRGVMIGGAQPDLSNEKQTFP